MAQNLAQKIIGAHLVAGEMIKGKEIQLEIDQTLTQDATGTMAYLQFEAMGIPKVRTQLSVSYVDHNTLQEDFKNPDDHVFLQTLAAKFGIVFSRPGNGICHQVHLERFGKPGTTLLGSDSHTPTGGGLGQLAIGAGGLDVALAMAGQPLNLKMPGIVRVMLKGKLQPWVAAKDIILEVLRRDTVKGGVGWIYEYAGPGVSSLSVPERATITNMGAELGATSSIFPSDKKTLAFLKAQGREADWVELKADPRAKYDREIVIDLNTLEPLAACPHMPDVVKTVRELAGTKVQQVAIGSCTNSSFKDMATVAMILKGQKIHASTVLGISPGSRQVLTMLAEKGLLTHIIGSGARMLENACGPCIGQGFAPPTKGVSVRTFNRNFEGRSGTKNASIFLVSPEVAAVAAIKGEFCDPREFGKYPKVSLPTKFSVDDSMIIHPPADGHHVQIVRGPNIAPLPAGTPLPATLTGKVLLVTGDNITTDHIMPAGKYLPLRSNVPEYAKHVFEGIDAKFHDRAKEWGGGFIVGGDNYGQGSSREHAALCPMYLGVKAVIVKSFARIHLANLINFGLVPFTFKNAADAAKVKQGDELSIDVAHLAPGSVAMMTNKTNHAQIELVHPLSARDIEVIKAGGALLHARGAH